MQTSLTEIRTPSKKLKNLFDAMMESLSGRRDFLEAMHLDAASLHERGLVDAAEPMFRYVYEHAGEYADLRAWARFKLAEIDLDSGKIDEATAGLEETLRIDPGHTKAQIMLTPKETPLSVVLGGAAQWAGQGIEASFHYNKPELWKYYFERRPIDVLWVAPPAVLLRFDPVALSSCLDGFFADDATVNIALNESTYREFGMDEMQFLVRDPNRFRQEIQNALNELCA